MISQFSSSSPKYRPQQKIGLVGLQTASPMVCISSLQTVIEAVPSNLSPMKDPDRLLQDVDINRLRAVVFRDVVSAGSCVHDSVVLRACICL